MAKMLWSSYTMGVEGKGTAQFHLQMLPSYRNKKEFVETLAHEMIHLWQMNH